MRRSSSTASLIASWRASPLSARTTLSVADDAPAPEHDRRLLGADQARDDDGGAYPASLVADAGDLERGHVTEADAGRTGPLRRS